MHGSPMEGGGTRWRGEEPNVGGKEPDDRGDEPDGGRKESKGVAEDSSDDDDDIEMSSSYLNKQSNIEAVEF